MTLIAVKLRQAVPKFVSDQKQLAVRLRIAQSLPGKFMAERK